MPEAALSHHVVPGWFGKLPHLGDFASRRLPPRFIRGWDDWLQHSLASARDELGELWLDVYLVAPVRRFWLAPGVLGRSAWAGVLMPSVDAVGRHFPMTIASPIRDVSKGLADVLAARAWFHAIDAAARQVLDVHCSVEDLEQHLAAVQGGPTDLHGDAPAQQLAGDLLRLQGHPTLQDADATLHDHPTLPASDAPDAQPLPASVWWCGDAHQPAQFTCHPLLPPATAFVALLAGEV